MNKQFDFDVKYKTKILINPPMLSSSEQQKLYCKNYYLRNKEKLNQLCKEYYKQHKQYYKEYCRTYYAKNKAKIKEYHANYIKGRPNYMKEYYQANADKLKQYCKDYYYSKKHAYNRISRNNEAQHVINKVLFAKNKFEYLVICTLTLILLISIFTTKSKKK